MISKMGIVTLFCNIAAAIGFGVFALTKSAISKRIWCGSRDQHYAAFFYFHHLDPRSAQLSCLIRKTGIPNT